MEPLTPDGITIKKDELYALSDNELIEQARAICHDLKAWIEDHFTLSPQQSDYLGGIPGRVLFGWGAQLAAIVISRGDLELDMAPHNDPKRTKQTDIFCSGFIHYEPEGASTFDVQGSYTETLP
ncbi:hypothetical protein OOZ15_13525 [Galbibacter sp. EGI 63066]|uniref:hypothetical protein n=1 Tax=Galbibacter sp. EGI 63066 TaxID=2993559 RepID=UPI0022498621|nr:hypothetical protein [Galbibacter sp. EGI 63066]MCX2680968.1 hypothetical protein [Galbibacter sp. EGI 63066]